MADTVNAVDSGIRCANVTRAELEFVQPKPRPIPSLRFYAVGSSLFLLSVCFCLCSLFYRDDVLCWLLLARPFLYAFHAHLRFPVDLVWFRLSCDHGWIRSGSVNVRKQQQQQQWLFVLCGRPSSLSLSLFPSECPPPFAQFQVSTQVLALILSTCWAQHFRHALTSSLSTLLRTRV